MTAANFHQEYPPFPPPPPVGGLSHYGAWLATHRAQSVQQELPVDWCASYQAGMVDTDIVLEVDSHAYTPAVLERERAVAEAMSERSLHAALPD